MPKSGKVILRAEPGVKLDKKQVSILKDYIPYCVRSLDLENDYTGIMTNDRKKYEIETTGMCMPSKGEFYVYCEDRSLIDILRTISHELAHLSQHEREVFDPDEIHFSSDSEDEANMLAGELVNAFVEVVGYDTLFEGKDESR